jgi:hypothetical protein
MRIHEVEHAEKGLIAAPISPVRFRTALVPDSIDELRLVLD